MNIMLEGKECFDKQEHEQHVWHEKFVCTGKGIGDDEYSAATEKEREASFDHFNRLYNNPDVDDVEVAIALGAMPEAPAVLDGRAAYGNRVVNMRQQADMWNAYLDGRTIEAHDVPIMFVLTKLHRLGRMPDYADNYNDVDGYMQIAREVIGSNMVEAATAKEYQELKANRWDNEEIITRATTRLATMEPIHDTTEDVARHRIGSFDFTDAEIDAVLDHYRHIANITRFDPPIPFDPAEKIKPRHPYEAAQQLADAEEQVVGRCGRPADRTVNGHRYLGPCVLGIGHTQVCQPPLAL